MTPPAVSVGLAVRNDPDGVARCIESVLSQEFNDLELVICDNASDDDTVDVLQAYARQDRRVKVAVNPANIGSHENMNRVFALSSGSLFRWVSADDWLEPQALAEAVQTLRAHPDAVGVTAGFTIHSDGQTPRFERYFGEFPTSADPGRRFERMLWFFHAGDTKYDPVYGVYRREHFLRSGRVRPNERTDWLLSAELALMGPIFHIPDVLAHRGRSYPTKIDRVAFRRRLDPVRGEQIKTSATKLSHDLYRLALRADLTPAQLKQCRAALTRFWLIELKRTYRMRALDVVHRLRHE